MPNSKILFERLKKSAKFQNSGAIDLGLRQLRLPDSELPTCHRPRCGSRPGWPRQLGAVSLQAPPGDKKQNCFWILKIRMSQLRQPKVISWSYGAILFYQKWVFATQKKRFLFFWQPKKEIFFFGSQKRKSSFLVPKKGKSSFLVPKKERLLIWCQKKEEILFFGHF